MNKGGTKTVGPMMLATYRTITAAGTCWHTCRGLAALTGASECTTSRHLRAMLAAGILECAVLHPAWRYRAVGAPPASPLLTALLAAHEVLP